MAEILSSIDWEKAFEGAGTVLKIRKETIKLINKREKLFSVYRRTNRLINLDRY